MSLRVVVLFVLFLHFYELNVTSLSFHVNAAGVGFNALKSLLNKVPGAVRLVADEEEQLQLLTAAIEECVDKMKEFSEKTTPSDAAYCPIDFDKVACWPRTPANTTATISCPHYLHLFDSRGTASRYCTSDGTWAIIGRNISQGDYRQCFVSEEEIFDLPADKIDRNSQVQDHLPYLVTICIVGNSLSITALLLALLLFGYFRKLLRCNRNIIHTNMFISFVLRGVLVLIHFLVTARHDQQIKSHLAANNLSAAELINLEQSNWGCKLATSIWMYAKLTNFMWLFIEALYLHLLIFVLTFNDKVYAFRIIVFGWGIPLIFIVPWVMTRIFVDNRRCWINYEFEHLKWIIEVPIIGIVVVNTGFFINFIKLLATKLRNSETIGYKQKVGRRLAKSALVLIPLFGIHYIVFLFISFYPGVIENLTLELFSLYFDSIFTSFQGLFVAVLFCFLNADVIYEVQKIWVRFKFRYGVFLNRMPRTSVTSDTAVTFASRRQSSSNGLLTTSLTTDSRAASLRRGVSVPSMIDEELDNFNPEKNDENQNLEVEPFLVEG